MKQFDAISEGFDKLCETYPDIDETGIPLINIFGTHNDQKSTATVTQPSYALDKIEVFNSVNAFLAKFGEKAYINPNVCLTEIQMKMAILTLVVDIVPMSMVNDKDQANAVFPIYVLGNKDVPVSFKLSVEVKRNEKYMYNVFAKVVKA
jgi:hypothetical protein